MTIRVLLSNHVVPVVLMSIVFMLLMPYGTFNPTRLGFYLSILCAVFTVEVTRALINRFRVKDKE